MNIHEYQAKQVLKQNGINVMIGQLARNPVEAEIIARRIGGSEWVVKAQIQAGGRAKAGGIKIARSISEVKEHTVSMIGTKLVTSQTGPKGIEVKSVLIEQSCEVEAQYYISLIIDRSEGSIVMIASEAGGVDFEKTILNSPEKIVKVPIQLAAGYFPYIGRKIAYSIGMKGEVVEKAIDLFESLYKIFVDYDCTLIEINPLVLTANGELLPLDAKIEFDDNALFRQEELQTYRDVEERNLEIEEMNSCFTYLQLEGNIGCLANGAGLAMTTLDMVKHSGGKPADFLDITGRASVADIETAFLHVLTDDRLRGVFVNIFGGLVKCDYLAQGLLNAVSKVELKIPLVVRLEGTNVALGKKILKESSIPIIWAKNLEEGAKKIVAAVDAMEDR